MSNAQLQAALDVCEGGQELSKEQAFQMLQGLKEEARPETFNAVWNKLQIWDFNFKGLVLDGVPVIDPRRMVELRTAKPAQTVNWEAAGKAAPPDLLKRGSGAAVSQADSLPQSPAAGKQKPGPEANAKASQQSEVDAKTPKQPEVAGQEKLPEEKPPAKNPEKPRSVIHPFY